MLFLRFGRAIAEKFLVPYNEKLYATDLSRLDPDAMGRFFPNANLSEVMRQLKAPDNASYNSTFTYPEGGAIQFVNALASAVIAPKISLNEVLLKVDPKRRVAQTSKREIRFERLISSEVTPGTWTSNKVLVFNLGFDRKGPRDVHWIYYPDPGCVFYRVGFYDNIFDTDRLSTYVEVGLPTQVTTDPEFIERTRKRVLEDMRRHGIIQDHELVAEHHVVMDPAYVHLTGQSIAEHSRLCSALNTQGIYSIGRYGGWTYCSIEDNIVEARRLVSHLNS
jgi:protoporphyrinogen oxidase